MFEYAGEVHFAGVKYDKKAARQNGDRRFCAKYLSLYMDKKYFCTMEEFQSAVKLNGDKASGIESGIVVGEEYDGFL